MNMTRHERPGVYSSYDASSVVTGAAGGGVVGIAALSTGGTAGKLYRVSRQEDAAAAFGAEDGLTRLVGLLFRNGAGEVCAVPVGAQDGYEAAFALLDGEEDIRVVVCDCTALAVQQALKEHVTAASEARRERIAVLGGAAGENAAQLAERAGELNCERMVLVAPCEEGGAAGGAAAAVAGAVALERDPAVPLGGAVLKGLGELAARYGDDEIDTLVRGGVTPLERAAGTVSVVRGVTTRTKTGGAADSTWRELSTIRIIDEVIPSLRNALRAKFHRAKNTEQSRGAVRSQVVVELEDRVSREIIDAYENVTVSAKSDDPTVCLVEFSFAVVHGMNQIWLNAHITV